MVALGEPMMAAETPADVAAKVRVWAPGVVMIRRLSNVATPAVADLMRVPETAPEPVARVTVTE